MGDKTGIEWCDATWNVVTGCTRVSPGCDHCYIPTTAPFRMVGRKFDGQGPGSSTGLVFHPERFQWPLSWTRPRRIFVNSLSDLFHEDVPDQFIARMFAVMGLASRHTFQILTKRHGRMRSLLSSPAFRIAVLDQAYLMVRGEVEGVRVPKPAVDSYLEGLRAALAHKAPGPGLDVLPYPLPNVHLGVSVEDQQRADLRIPALLETPAAVRFLSCEPLLGPVDLSLTACVPTARHHGRRGDPDCPETLHHHHDAKCSALFSYPAGAGVRDTGIDWVIVGGESGRDARPMHPQWARDLRDQCTNAGVPFLFKQYGEWAPGFRNSLMSKHRWQYESIRFAPDGTVYRADQPDLYSYPGMEQLLRVGKHKAGRELDGRTWDEYPEAVTA